jgi:hypothetical protein
VADELLGGLLLSDPLCEHLQGGPRLVDTSTVAAIGTALGDVRARELDGDGVRRDGVDASGGGAVKAGAAAGGATTVVDV